MKKEASIQHALEEIERMPGIGPKSAQRILNWLLTSDDEVALGIAEAIVDVKKAIHLCPRCHNFAEGELCAICSDPQREVATICVVAEPRDVEAIERTGIYQGLYHVLGGVINPMEGSMPEDLHIADLMARLGSEAVEEVLVATNRGRDHGQLPGAHHQAARHSCDALGQRPSRGRGTRICR